MDTNPEQTQKRHEILSKLKAENPNWGRVRLSEASGIPPSSVKRWLAKNQLNDQHDIPAGYKLKGTSTLYNADGDITQQWVKTCEDRERLEEQIKELTEAIIEPCRGVVENIQAPNRTNKELMTVYPVADLHLGMFAWGTESGASYDTKKAVNLLNKASGRLIAKSPNSETCLIANLGDFFHADSVENKTMRSGNVLDVDTRWAKVLWAGVKAYRDLIKMALTKHKKVYVKSVIGNHDDHSNVALSMAIKLAFENNPRVEVELPINPFQYHTFGDVLLGMVHDCKPQMLEGIMATDMRREWGEAKHCHWLTAHLHTQKLFEYPGCIVESFRTLAAKDAWTHRKGYRSSRGMQSIVYHHKYGEVERANVGVDYL